MPGIPKSEQTRPTEQSDDYPNVTTRLSHTVHAPAQLNGRPTGKPLCARYLAGVSRYTAERVNCPKCFHRLDS